MEYSSVLIESICIILFYIVVESYMHVFGAGELSEFHPVDNNHFKQFYLHEQERYELELFHSRSAFMTGGMHAYPQSHNSDICVHQAQFMNHQNALIADRVRLTSLLLSLNSEFE